MSVDYVYGMKTVHHTFGGGAEGLAAAVKTAIDDRLSQVVELRLRDDANSWSYAADSADDFIDVPAGTEVILPWIDGHNDLQVNGTGASTLQITALGPKAGEPKV